MRNIEIKAKIENFLAIAKRASELSKSQATIIKQNDVFFVVPNGRLKLRQFQDGSGELIFYDRPDSAGPKLSNYVKTDLLAEAFKGVKECLAKSNGVLGSVVKTRHLYIIGQTRVHVDHVENLGDFMELEVTLRDDQSIELGETIANSLMKELGIPKSNLLSGAYLDLLLKDKQ